MKIDEYIKAFFKMYFFVARMRMNKMRFRAKKRIKKPDLIWIKLFFLSSFGVYFSKF